MVTNGKTELLDSWKEIAAFFRRGVRTVQRWEQEESLPVHRHHHVKRGSVFALRSELTFWQQTRNQRMRQSDGEFDRLHLLMSEHWSLMQDLKQLLAENMDTCVRIQQVNGFNPPQFQALNGRQRGSPAL